MHEILANLTAESYVLDVGCAYGSFSPQTTAARCVRLDRQVPNRQYRNCLPVQGDASYLPFRSGVFAAVVANHSLEHFEDLSSAVNEIGRVTCAAEGALFVAVPDASTFTDRLYRWLSRGGGHVNAFTCAAELARMIESATGLQHVAIRTLCSSLSFLNRQKAPRPLPRRLALVGGGYRWSLFGYVWASRRLDRIIHSRTSVYGWALYFGSAPTPIDTRTWVNVCIFCGAGCSSIVLAERVRTVFGIKVYACPGCATLNPYIEDFFLL